MTIDEMKMHELLGKMVGDMGAAAVAPLVILGDRLGLYKALAADGPLTTEELADRTGTTERYVREWCAAQAGSGYITYDADDERFSMTPEQQAVFADSDSPMCMTGAYYSISSMFTDEPKITHAFQTGEGVAWGDHSECLFCGVEKFFRPGYQANIVSEWLPALDGVIEGIRETIAINRCREHRRCSACVSDCVFPIHSVDASDRHGC